jgi:hypothetical protein
MTKDQSGIAMLTIVIVAVVILFTAIVAFFSFQSRNSQSGNEAGELKIDKKKSETAVWTVYRNEQNGFEIKFPEYGSVDDTDLGKIYAFGAEISASQWKDGKVAVVNHGNIGTLSLKEFVAADLAAQGIADASLKETKFNGYDSVLAKGQIKTSYYILHNLDVFEIYKTGSAADIDKTLSTFKFIEQ